MVTKRLIKRNIDTTTRDPDALGEPHCLIMPVDTPNTFREYSGVSFPAATVSTIINQKSFFKVIYHWPLPIYLSTYLPSSATLLQWETPALLTSPSVLDVSKHIMKIYTTPGTALQ